MSWATELSTKFIGKNEPRSWPPNSKLPKSITPLEMYFQESNGDIVPNALEVLLAETSSAPKVADARTLWNKQWGKRSAPVLLIVAYPSGDGMKAAVCGSASENPPILTDIDLDQATRIAVAAMAEPNHHTAIRSLRQMLPQLDPPFDWMKSGPLGLGNTGLFATQELISGVPERTDWNEAVEKSQPMLELRGHELIKRLGFRIETSSNHVSKLIAAGETRAIALFCNNDESFEAPSQRLNGFSPVSRALAEAGRDPENRIGWVILTRGSEIRLYAARPDVGVSSKGRGETYVEINLIALPYDSAGYLQMLFSAQALAPEGSVEETLEASDRFAAKLAHRLRERVYNETVPILAEAVAVRLQKRSKADDLSGINLSDAYEQVMFILFRLLFVAYAEAVDLLPYKTNGEYKAASLANMIRNLGNEEFSENSTKLWDGVLYLWEAINDGNTDLGVPVYNGGLFSSDQDTSEIGREISKLSKLKDSEFAPALASMFLDEGPEGIGPVDFRSLSVREFGTIYEGLLESRLVLHKDSIELVNRSGDKKASGTYFTKQFVVEHLLDQALEPALDRHIQELSAISHDDAALAEKFFDFKCADIAMGSGHFLVAALDRIESRLSAFLINHPIAGITSELERLLSAAKKALENTAEATDIETSSLLRRQVARHCVYGVDINHIAVELARLSIWIHTFIPGLPLSFLDHNFVCGDSLTGVGTLDEAKLIFGDDENSLFVDEISNFLKRSEKSLNRLAHTSDATKQEIEVARNAHLQAREDVRSAKSFFDLITAERDPDCEVARIENFSEGTVNAAASKKSIAVSINGINPLHFPVAFPEVFVRDNPGFDVILGNPPWEKVKVEEHSWWSMHWPGLKSLTKPEKDKVISKLKRTRPYLEQQFEDAVDFAKRYRELIKSTFAKLGSGDTDLHKAFSWRIFQLTRNDGYAGIVLPRSVTQSGGSKEWREEVLKNGSFSSVITLQNKKCWVFEDVHQMYTVALVTISNNLSPNRKISFAGPFSSHAELKSFTMHEVPIDEFLAWSNNISFPSIPQRQGAGKLFRKLRGHQRLDNVTETLDPTTISSKQQAASSKQQAASSKQQAASSKQQAASSKQQAASSKQQAASSKQQAASSKQQAASSKQQAASSKQQAKTVYGTSLCQRPPLVHAYRELDSSADRKYFIFGPEGNEVIEENWPVYKGESFNIWQNDTGKYFAHTNTLKVTTHLQRKRVKAQNNSNSPFSDFDSSILADKSSLHCYSPRIAFRRTTHATNKRTIITALIPPEVVAQDSAAVLLWPDGTSPVARSEAFLLGLLSSMILDWYARRVTELNFGFHLFNNLPIPEVDIDPSTGDPTALRVIEISGRLAAIDKRFKEWADEVGVPVGSANDPETKEALIHELDACVAHLYGLDEEDLACLYETFHNLGDYDDRHAAVLELFRNQPWLKSS